MAHMSTGDSELGSPGAPMTDDILPAGSGGGVGGGGGAAMGPPDVDIDVKRPENGAGGAASPAMGGPDGPSMPVAGGSARPKSPVVHGSYEKADSDEEEVMVKTEFVWADGAEMDVKLSGAWNGWMPVQMYHEGGKPLCHTSFLLFPIHILSIHVARARQQRADARFLYLISIW